MKVMSKYTILFLLSSIQWIYSQSVNFEKSIETAFEKAKANNKIVFIEYYNTDCSICKSIEPLFDNPEIAAFYNSNFVSYKMNLKNGLKGQDSLFMAQTKLKFSGVPFFLFFDNAKNFIHYSGAKNDVNYILNIGKKALNKEERLGNVENKYNAGDRSIKTLYSYTDLLQLQQDYAMANKVTSQLYEVYPKQNLSSHQSYLILKNAVTSIDNGFFKYWYENKDKLTGFEKGPNSGTEIKLLEQIVIQSIRNEKQDWDLSKIKEVKQITVNLGMSKDGNDFLWEDEVNLLIKYNENEETQNLFKLLLNQSKNIYSSLYITDYFVNRANEPLVIKTILVSIQELMKSDMEAEQKGDLMLQELICYQKLKDFSNLNSKKQKALDFYKKSGLDTQLLNQL
jgi:thiol-disulfide isomerase/thioredoxin